jgi:hypothetical protein
MRVFAALCCLFLAAATFGQDAIPRVGIVPDSATAVKIAEAVLTPVYGQQKIESQRPFTARLKDNVWTVSGTLYCADAQLWGQIVQNHCTGLLEARISKEDGRIIKIIHYK